VSLPQVILAARPQAHEVYSTSPNDICLDLAPAECGETRRARFSGLKPDFRNLKNEITSSSWESPFWEKTPSAKLLASAGLGGFWKPISFIHAETSPRCKRHSVDRTPIACRGSVRSISRLVALHAEGKGYRLALLGP